MKSKGKEQRTIKEALKTAEIITGVSQSEMFSILAIKDLKTYKNKVLFFSSYINPGSERYGKKTQANRHLTFNKNPFTKDKNFIWRGDTGITGVQVTQKSFFVKQLTVNWTYPDPNDFEKIIKPAFLKQAKKWNMNKIKKILDKTYSLELEIKSNSIVNKNILLKKLLIDICNLANAS